MLAAKIIAASVILISLVFRAVLDFFWRDKRTNRYRYARNAFITAAIIGALLNAVVLGLDEFKKEAATESDRLHRIELENGSLGALTPDIWIFLYTGQKLVCPPHDKYFPGDNSTLDLTSQIGIGPQPTLCVLVLNTNSFPIYDLKTYLFQETPNRDNTKTLNDFREFKPMPILYPDEHTMVMYNMPSNLTSKFLDFVVQTRRGTTKHTIGFTLVSNQWEYCSLTLDLTHHSRVSSYISDNFPRDSNGIPHLQYFTEVRVQNSNEPTSKP